MQGEKWPAVVIMASAAAAGAVLAWQHQAAQQLRDEIELLRRQNHNVVQLDADNRRLSAEQVSPAELQALRDDHAAAVRLRGEIEAFRARVDEMTPPAASPPPSDMQPASAWKNAGRATPAAAVETLLWAVAGGDMDTMAAGIILDPGARTKAEAQLAQLPEAVRLEYGTPEKLVALLLAKNAATVSAMEVVSQTQVDDDTSNVRVRVKGEGDTTKEAVFTFQKGPVGWQLKVPANGTNK